LNESVDTPFRRPLPHLNGRSRQRLFFKKFAFNIFLKEKKSSEGKWVGGDAPASLSGGKVTSKSSGYVAKSLAIPNSALTTCCKSINRLTTSNTSTDVPKTCSMYSLLDYHDI
jgi:hypothetical protein